MGNWVENMTATRTCGATWFARAMILKRQGISTVEIRGELNDWSEGQEVRIYFSPIHSKNQVNRKMTGRESDLYI